MVIYSVTLFKYEMLNVVTPKNVGWNFVKMADMAIIEQHSDIEGKRSTHLG